MTYLSTKDPIAVAAYNAIHGGDLQAMKQLLADHPSLSTTKFVTDRVQDGGRTLLHGITDWPGYFPNGAEMVKLIIKAGADVNAHTGGPNTETPLHWAASCNDVEVLDALLDCGADIEIRGSVIGGGSPLNNAVAFGQWDAARRLFERGAYTSLQNAAGLGALARVQEYFAGTTPTPEEINNAFWFACHGGQFEVAEYLLTYHPDVNRLPDWEKTTPLDAAVRSNYFKLVRWLRHHGSKSFNELNGPC